MVKLLDLMSRQRVRCDIQIDYKCNANDTRITGNAGTWLLKIQLEICLR